MSRSVALCVAPHLLWGRVNSMPRHNINPEDVERSGYMQ